MLNKAPQIIQNRTCPTCGLGFMNEIGKNVYQCDRSRCNAVFDFSAYSDEEIRKALQESGG